MKCPMCGEDHDLSVCAHWKPALAIGDGHHRYRLSEQGKPVRNPNFDKEHQNDLIEKAQDGDKKALHQLVEENMGLIHSELNKMKGFVSTTNLMEYQEFIHEGVLGLIKAIERFDTDNGAALSTYATLWIKDSMRQARWFQDRTVRLPAWVEKDEGVREQWKIGRDPEFDLTLLEDECERAEQLVEEVERKQRVSRILAGLPNDEQREGLCRRFGLNGYIPHTQAEVGEAMGKSRGWVGWVFKRAQEIGHEEE